MIRSQTERSRSRSACAARPSSIFRRICVTHFVPTSQAQQEVGAWYKDGKPGTNTCHLFENDGHGAFRDVTAERGLDRAVVGDRVAAVGRELRVDGEPLEALTVEQIGPHAATFVTRPRPRPGLADSTLLVVRRRYVGNGMVEDVTLENLSGREVDVILTLTPHIIRNAEITEEDLLPIWVGTEANITFRANSPRVEGVTSTSAEPTTTTPTTTTRGA